MKNITILALHLGYGGAERCICSLANSLVNNYNVEILSIYKLYDEPAFKLDSRVHVRYLTNVVPNRNDFKYALKHLNIFKLVKETFKAIKILRIKRKSLIDAIDSCNSNIIISTREYTNKYLGEYKNAGVYTIAWEHNHPHGNKEFLKKVVKSCKKIDTLVTVSPSIEKIYQEAFKKENISCQVTCIPNFIEELPNNSSSLENKNIIAVGRLEPEKGFLDLINVFKLIEFKDGDTYLNIVGDGSQKNKIFKSIVDNNLSRKTRIHGFLSPDKLAQLYNSSSLLLMTSYTESFGLVILEAMAHGLPVIAFSSAEGARDLIENNYNGYLIKNRNEFLMADAATKLLNNPKELKRLSNNAKKKALSYTKEEIMKKWSKLIDEIIL